MSDYKVIKLMRNGCEYCLPGSGKDYKFIDFLLIGGGGGGGGGGTSNYNGGGGGGAGGFIEQCKYALDSSTINIVIGARGDGGAVNCQGCNGGDSCLGNIVAYGGGGGGGESACAGKNGGSGGGTILCTPLNCIGKSCPGQGSDGGTGFYYGCCRYAGGGGGAGGSGWDGHCTDYCGGRGGKGRASCLSGTSYTYAGGGGGGHGYYCNGYNTESCGGAGGGGKGGGCRNQYGGNATNYGSGGGGAGCGVTGGNGYQGLAIIRYPTDGSYGINCATGGCVYTCGDYTIHCFTSDGTFCIVS